MHEERFVTKKSLGQNFLNNPTVPRAMCEAADLRPGETVVEVGPGTGALTRELLARGAKVIALEADTRAIEILQETFAEACAEGSLEVHHADLRRFDLGTLPLKDQGYVVVSNIPYYLTGMLFRTFLEHSAQPRTLVFLIQKEVAKRITSSRERGEKESLLSLSVKIYGEPHYVRTVPRTHFTPQPNVDSAIVLIDRITRARAEQVDAAHFFDILHLGFGKKRKQLLGNLTAAYPRETLIPVFSTLGLALDVRAEDLSLDTWCALVPLLPKQRS